MGVSAAPLRMLHCDSHFRTNLRVLGRRGDRNWGVSASLRGTDQFKVSFGPLAGFLICQPQRGFIIRNGAREFERRLPFPRTINEYP